MEDGGPEGLEEGEEEGQREGKEQGGEGTGEALLGDGAVGVEDTWVSWVDLLGHLFEREREGGGDRLSLVFELE